MVQHAVAILAAVERTWHSASREATSAVSDITTGLSLISSSTETAVSIAE